MTYQDRVLPGRILRDQYDEVVGDVQAQLRRLLGFFKLPFDQACLDVHSSVRIVRTASSQRVR